VAEAGQFLATTAGVIDQGVKDPGVGGRYQRSLGKGASDGSFQWGGIRHEALQPAAKATRQGASGLGGGWGDRYGNHCSGGSNSGSSFVGSEDRLKKDWKKPGIGFF
jgi:hypothetical protein